MKIAVSVDDHLDVNKLDWQALVPQQAAYLQAQGAAAYLNAGDTFNDFKKSVTYFHALQQAVGPQMPVRFLAGNHDLVNGITYAQAQGAADPLYLHERTLTLPGSDTVIIGNNGWYDYSLAPRELGKTPADFAQWKRAYWLDSAIDQPVSDAVRMARVLTTTEAALRQAAGRRVIYLTHFVPRRDFMVYNPKRTYWQMATALMGSQALGVLLERYAVAEVVFGHLHIRQPAQTFGRTTYHHQPVGYGLRRLNEWVGHDFLTEWQQTLVWLDV
ncbi:MAG: metallophosphoesterase [Lactobacillus sp.]|jgi:putative phosphoesterase|nr:metallophosphoesterase [Lactobacillus sp.]MCI2032120.1 metallophosphoesterase [Lactobacillus sp.]